MGDATAHDHSQSASRLVRARTGWLREDFADRTRARAATLNQLLLGSVVFVLGILIAIGPFTGDVVMFFTGVVIIFVLTGATLVIPWNRVAFGWVAVVPAIDIVAITLMQLAAPGSALGLLWIFPTTWLAAGFGLLGLFAVIVAVAGIVSVLAALNEQQVTYATVLMPLVLVAVADDEPSGRAPFRCAAHSAGQAGAAAATRARAHPPAGAGGDGGARCRRLRRDPRHARRSGRRHE